MPDKKISALTSASLPLAGTEVLPIVQGGVTTKVAVSDLTAGRAVTAASVNKVAITAPATASTLTIADGKTLAVNDNATLGTGGLTLGNSGGFTAAASKVLTASNSLTLAGTDATTHTFPTTSATIARTDAAQTFTGTQTFSDSINSTFGVTGTLATNATETIITAAEGSVLLITCVFASGLFGAWSAGWLVSYTAQNGGMLLMGSDTAGRTGLVFSGANIQLKNLNPVSVSLTWVALRLR